MTSVLLEATVLYGDEFNTFTNLAVKNIVACRDEVSGLGQSLFLGATEDVTIQAAHDLVFNLGLSDTLNINAYNSTNALRLTSIPSTTQFTTLDKDFTLTTSDNSLYKVNIGSTSIFESNNYQHFDTAKPLGFLVNNSLVVNGGEVVTGSVAVGGNLTVGSNLYTKHLSLIKQTSNTNIGFAFNINDREQLEIVKYTTFDGSASVAKRIAVFGSVQLRSNDSSDVVYTEYENAANYSVSNVELINSITTQYPKLLTTSNIADGAVTTTKLGADVGKWSVLGSNVYYGSNANDGCVGIGTMQPNYRLEVIGEVFSSGSVLTSSDERVKSDITVITNALDKLSQLHGYTYTRNDDGKRYAGVLAQEVQKVLPEVVSTTADGQLSVAYGNMIALAIESIKELHKMVLDGVALRDPVPA